MKLFNEIHIKIFDDFYAFNLLCFSCILAYASQTGTPLRLVVYVNSRAVKRRNRCLNKVRFSIGATFYQVLEYINFRL